MYGRESTSTWDVFYTLLTWPLVDGGQTGASQRPCHAAATVPGEKATLVLDLAWHATRCTVFLQPRGDAKVTRLTTSSLVLFHWIYRNHSARPNWWRKLIYIITPQITIYCSNVVLTKPLPSCQRHKKRILKWETNKCCYLHHVRWIFCSLGENCNQ